MPFLWAICSHSLDDVNQPFVAGFYLTIRLGIIRTGLDHFYLEFFFANSSTFFEINEGPLFVTMISSTPYLCRILVSINLLTAVELIGFTAEASTHLVK